MMIPACCKSRFDELAVQSHEISRVVSQDGTVAGGRPCQLLVIGCLSQSCFSARGQVDAAISQRPHEGGGLRVFVEMQSQLIHAEAGKPNAPAAAWRSVSRYPSISFGCR